MYYVTVIGYLFVALVDFPSLFKNKNLRTTIAVITIYVIGLAMSILFALGVEIPSPLNLIGDFFKNVLHLSY